jgi:hypothetical protein
VQFSWYAVLVVASLDIDVDVDINIGIDVHTATYVVVIVIVLKCCDHRNALVLILKFPSAVCGP